MKVCCPGLGNDEEFPWGTSIFCGVADPLPPPLPRPRTSELHRSRRSFGGRGTPYSVGSGGRSSLSNKRRRDGRRHWPKRVVIGLASLLVLVVLAGVATFFYARYRFDQIHKASVKGLVARVGNAPFDILLVGSDSRAFVDNSTQAAQFGSTANAGGQRSDVIIVARIVPATHQVKLLSIPRDTWVSIPGNTAGISGPNRINAAFNNGPSLLVQTVEQTFHIPITYYAEVNFPGFAGMVNSLGGVGLNFADPVKDAYSGLNITHTGCQLVNGTQALALVRSRHLYYYSGGTWNYDGNSDFSRIQRQDAFFRAIVSKLRGAVGNPLTLNSFVGASTKNVTIDQTLSEGELVSLGRIFRSFTSQELQTETLPTSPTVINGADVLLPAPGPDAQVLNAFLAFGSPSASTTATSTTAARLGTAGSPAPATGIQLVSADRALQTSQSVTVTTLPGTPAVPNSSVDYNTSAEPWNPTPCTP
ncbi:MAG: cell envelope-related transcriptional attenuator [Acidimicrobiaceae bacterium]|nr:cell envelope-related transcriptional attenuator [Acidimicrobiaceae bacterium]